jgi:amino acid permease
VLQPSGSLPHGFGHATLDAAAVVVVDGDRGVAAVLVVGLGAVTVDVRVALDDLAAAYVSPDRVFSFLISSYGAVALFVYLLIAIAQIRLRRRLEREDPDSLVFRMWLFPWLSYLTIAGMVAVIAAMAISADTRKEFFLSLLVLGITLAAYGLTRGVRRRQGRGEIVEGQVDVHGDGPEHDDEDSGDTAVSVHDHHSGGVERRVPEPVRE